MSRGQSLWSHSQPYALATRSESDAPASGKHGKTCDTVYPAWPLVVEPVKPKLRGSPAGRRGPVIPSLLIPVRQSRFIQSAVGQQTPVPGAF